ncbi:RHS repeat domain-containing protein [Phaeocystidibacter luteus]|uniref:RHS repeat-associated core domain-containing protein n=1 Tax=Phaeocystidibacter luteus TaxID=911197 RepID=A0A6N6RIP6_9FLAO|nr:RHS repeat-associated core domain-containing protein [Phaeocystidibacter luteus]KAB2805308.1 RHS repeat-associated core domain-containing protein [Phaeocystidibacter luteus]
MIESYFTGALQTTKHYYMGMTRVATDISLAEVMEEQMKTSTANSDNTVDATRNSENGNERSFNDPVIVDLQNQLESFDLVQDKDFTQRELKTRPRLAEYYPQYAEASQGKSDLTCCFEGLRYWYHPDYLGSVDMITDDAGKVHQYFHYTPWGEQMYTYTSSNQTYESEYFFNGKEFDEETGLGYYGARYYESQVSSWLSVDRFAEKYPNSSSYSFSGNNPIVYIDPNGDSLFMTAESWGFLSRGLNKLGVGALFSYDADKGAVVFNNEADLHSFSDEQLDVIERIACPAVHIESNISARVEDRSTPLPEYNGMSMEDKGTNGATLVTKWRTIVNVTMIEGIESPFKLFLPTLSIPDRLCFLQTVYPAEQSVVLAREPVAGRNVLYDLQMVSALHEIGGHGYRSIIAPNESIREDPGHNADVESYMRMVRLMLRQQGVGISETPYIH